MFITKKNLKELNKISLHDSVLNDIIYVHSEKKNIINLESEWEDYEYNLNFVDVLFYEMTCCDFWGSGYNIIEWSVIDTFEIFCKLLEIEKNIIIDLNEYFGIEILINSGDKLNIVCKSINVIKVV